MKIDRKIVVFGLCTVIMFMRCTSKGDIIVEPRFGTYEFNTYTIDTFRLKVILNGELLTDSLLSPKGSIRKIVKFFDATGKLLILDANNNDQVILDSVIRMKVGTTSISVIQFEHGARPAPPPIPNEPPPAPGNYKARVQYIRPTNSSVPFFDTVRCVVYDFNGIPVDTVDLAQYGVTPFYEAKAGVGQNFTVALYNTNFEKLHTNPVNGRISSSSEGFKTAVVYSTGRSGTRYSFKLEFAY